MVDCVSHDTHRNHRGRGNAAWTRRRWYRARLRTQDARVSPRSCWVSCRLPRRGLFARFLDAHQEPIDAGPRAFFPAPHSYTGEHVLELQGHGGPLVLEALIARCWSSVHAGRNRASSPNGLSSTTSSISHKPKPSRTSSTRAPRKRCERPCAPCRASSPTWCAVSPRPHRFAHLRRGGDRLSRGGDRLSRRSRAERAISDRARALRRASSKAPGKAACCVKG